MIFPVLLLPVPTLSESNGILNLSPQIVSQLFLFVMISTAFYLLIARPQKKHTQEHQMLIQSLKVGDIIYTNGGVVGKVNKLQEQFVQLQVSPQTLLYVQKHAIVSVVPKGSLKDSLRFE